MAKRKIKDARQRDAERLERKWNDAVRSNRSKPSLPAGRFDLVSLQRGIEKALSRNRWRIARTLLTEAYAMANAAGAPADQVKAIQTLGQELNDCQALCDAAATIGKKAAAMERRGRNRQALQLAWLGLRRLQKAMFKTLVASALETRLRHQAGRLREKIAPNGPLPPMPYELAWDSEQVTKPPVKGTPGKDMGFGLCTIPDGLPEHYPNEN